MDPAIASVENMVVTPRSTQDEYSGLETGEWWSLVSKNLKSSERGFFALSIILYTDAASPDFRRQLALQPIVISCGNFLMDITRRICGKRSVGYWPHIAMTKKGPRQRALARKLHHVVGSYPRDEDRESYPKRSEEPNWSYKRASDC